MIAQKTNKLEYKTIDDSDIYYVNGFPKLSGFILNCPFKECKQYNAKAGAFGIPCIVNEAVFSTSSNTPSKIHFINVTVKPKLKDDLLKYENQFKSTNDRMTFSVFEDSKLIFDMELVGDGRQITYKMMGGEIPKWLKIIIIVALIIFVVSSVIVIQVFIFVFFILSINLIHIRV